ncbi:patatin-like phospholipase protein [Ceratobasidium sp. AG-Ba]|nr:patatin-like phospholipase protein [Ceratobasidium sp. AG-Ba]
MKRFTSSTGSFGSSIASFGNDSIKKANSLTGGILGKQAPAVQEVREKPAIDPVPPRDTERPARILSLDGGGVRGYSTLIILKKFLLHLKAQSPDKKDILPADYFDLIIGTSTGGIIALMLGRLRMSVDEAIEAYQQLSKKIFAGGLASAVLDGSMLSSEKPGLGLGLGIVKGRELDQYMNMAVTTVMPGETSMYDAAKLEGYLKSTIGQQKYTIEREDALLEDEDKNNCCSAIVTAKQNNATAPHVMRSYVNPKDLTDDKIKIWEAARATSAAPAFFVPISIGLSKVKFIDGAVTGHCNPSELAREEAEAIWPGRKIGLLLSLGTGAPQEISLAGSNSSKLVSFIALSANTAQVHERVSRYFNQVCDGQSPYVRMSVEHSIDSIRLDDYEKLDQIAASTESYLGTENIKTRLDAAIGLGARTNEQVPATSFPGRKGSRSSTLQQPLSPGGTGA